MKELTLQEMGQASGGWAPIAGVALALIGKGTAGGPVAWAASSAGLILSVYQAAEHYGGQQDLGLNGPHCIAPGG